MQKWSLSDIFTSINNDIIQQLDAANKIMKHSTSKGDATEGIWIKLLNDYLPKRYVASRAFVADSNNKFSDQIDIVIYDRQYSPFLLFFGGQLIVPAESVYAVFEVKQKANKDAVKYARNKIASVRRLHRTSKIIKTINGKQQSELPEIIGGLITSYSKWKTALSENLEESLSDCTDDDYLDHCCIANEGLFGCSKGGKFDKKIHKKATIAFIFQLITKLQEMGTAPAVDMSAYISLLDNKN